MNVLSIVGARPQFVKLGPIAWAAKGKFEHRILHTGQHYDEFLSHSFFKVLDIPKPDFNLEVGSGSHGLQTGTMLIEIEKVLLDNRPDHVVVYGDTNTTLAGALAASKLKIPISHIEAGLRSFNRNMPEEINRILTDHVSSILFAPTKNALLNLENEGLSRLTVLSGDVMVETLNYIREKIVELPKEDDYIFCTIHRAENTDDPKRISKIIEELRKSAIRVHLHCHPRLKKVLIDLDIHQDSENLIFLPPTDYLSTITKLISSKGVITDSGGLQKEAYILGKPCLVVRSESEWIETIETGSNFLDPNLSRVSEEWWSKIKNNPNGSVFGDGSAAKVIVGEIVKSLDLSG
jgi:UDP-N-acetylglucosamine 2-epimerase